MFKCPACLHRAFRSLLNDFPGQEQLLLTRPIYPFRPIQRTQQFSSTPTPRATLRSLSKGHHRRTYLEARRELAKDRGGPFKGAAYVAPSLSNARRNKARELPADRRNRHAVENNQKHLLTPTSEKRELEVAAAKEAEWINDPLRLAERVLTYLRQDYSESNNGFEKAIELVRAAEIQSIKQGAPQGALNSIVSWNHLMNFCMSKSDPRSAYKVYNEMKKRGHRPDAHTYTIMLKGYGDNAKKSNALEHAMRVYDNISAPNSGVKPNTIHLNAALNVCARTGDMDSLWNVIGRAKTRGEGSPDVNTYTVVLNAIQNDIIKNTASLLAKDKNADVSKVFESAILDGRKVWSDVVYKWGAAEINVDEQLVCAMGRLLLMSKKTKDVMDVFRLVQQTMNIKIPRVPIERWSEQEDSEESKSPEDETVVEVFETDPWRQQQKQVVPIDGPAKALYATPGNNTLSMVLEAATVTKQMHIGKAYWELFVENQEGVSNIQPDSGNISAYLRLLRISRSSKAALEVLRRDWPDKVKERLYSRGNFVIAMSTCVRDKNNPNVFETASRILDIMQEKADSDREAALREEEEAAAKAERRSYRKKGEMREQEEAFEGHALELDPKVMTMYLNLAMWTTKGIAEPRLNPAMRLKRLKNGDLDFERDPSKNNTIRALSRLSPDIVNVRRMMQSRLAELEVQQLSPRDRLERSKKNRYWIDHNKTQERLEDLVGLFKGLISAYDRILSVNWRLEDEGMGPLDADWLEEVKLNKAKLNTYMTKIDRKVLNQMKLGKSGLWDGYDPTKKESDGDDTHIFTGAKYSSSKSGMEEPDTSYGAVSKDGKLVSEQNSTAEDELVPSDLSLHRTPGGARLHRQVSKQVKVIETQRENAKKWLSRRQRQEKETVRRQDRRGRMTVEEVRRKFSSPPKNESGEKMWTSERPAWKSSKKQNFEQKGWGGGFASMGEGQSNELLDVQSL